MPSSVDTSPGPTSAYVFISYARADAAYVKALVAALDAAGVPWWYDERLEGGDPFGRVLADRIDRCAAFVLVMSPDAAASAYVAKEVRRAQRGRRPIYPLLLAGKPLPAVADLQYVSVAGAVPPPASLLDALRTRVADPPPPATPGDARLVGRGFPLRNPHFVGREALLHRLAEDLLWSPVAVQALHGLGGVGKTQLAAAVGPPRSHHRYRCDEPGRGRGAAAGTRSPYRGVYRCRDRRVSRPAAARGRSRRRLPGN
ncbi:MAG: toll/interleukin-1 receptor domain-containing protein [Micromonosporaceae bacterium]|nr:toll/interleukin-1 receptor domain-containing protein [Micromonosporaceae bacterium]